MDIDNNLAKDLSSLDMSGFWKRKVHFTSLDETTLVEDIDDGIEIEGLTEADVEAIENLGFPRYEICSKKRLKEKWGCSEAHEFLLFPIKDYYGYLAEKDNRYLNRKKYSVKELAYLGFTFEFYERMVLHVVRWIRELIEKNKNMDVRSWESEIRLIKSDLRATKDQRIIELARRL